MNWFQRYGIPGSCFWGLSTLWFAAFYHLEFENIINSDEVFEIAKIIGGIMVASFLPIGYLISIFQQAIYLIIPFIGPHTTAIRRFENIFGFHENYQQRWERRQWKLEWNLEALTLISTVAATDRLKLDDQKFIQE